MGNLFKKIFSRLHHRRWWLVRGRGSFGGSLRLARRGDSGQGKRSGYAAHPGKNRGRFHHYRFAVRLSKPVVL